MALHPDFPESPYEILKPEHRWLPAAEELRSTAKEKLLPPLVSKGPSRGNSLARGGIRRSISDLESLVALVV